MNLTVKNGFFSALLLILVSGCAAIVPETPLNRMKSGVYSEYLKSQHAINSSVVDTRWYHSFADPVLNRLVEQAKKNNLEITIARSRIMEARANRNAEIAVYGPRLDLASSVTRQRLSENSTLPAGRISGFEVENTIYEVSFDASWELDFFGRNEVRRDRADDRRSLAHFEEREATVSVIAEVVRNYLELRLAQLEQRLLEENRARQEEMLTMAQTRLFYGEASESEVEQQRATLAELTARLPAKKAQERGSLYRLSVLTGQPPAQYHEELQNPAALPEIPSVVSVGLTSDLLRRRADIRIAEVNYVIADNNKRLAELALYPTFTLFGGGGPEATDLSDLLDPKSLALNLGAMLSWSLYDGGKRRAELDASQERQYQAEQVYSQVVLEALDEIEDYAVRFAESSNETKSLEQVSRSRQTLVDHSHERFRAGIINRYDVLQAQNARTDAELARFGAQAHSLLYLVSLYKSLGGGWE